MAPKILPQAAVVTRTSGPAELLTGRPPRSSLMIRMVQVAVGTVATPLVLILCAYVLTAADLHRFNRVYYSASMATLIGAMGFDFALSRVGVPGVRVGCAVLMNTLIGLLALRWLGLTTVTGAELGATAALAVAQASGNVFVGAHVFMGNTAQYLLQSALRAGLSLAAVLTALLARRDVIVVFVAAACLGALVAFLYRPSAPAGQHRGLRELYRVGFANCLINAAPSVGFLMDKTVAANAFSTLEANSYVFAWSFVMPALYLSNVIEKTIYSFPESRLRAAMSPLIAGCAAVLGVYGAVVVEVVRTMPRLIPHAVSQASVASMVVLMLAGYGVFALINGPLNGVFFRVASTSVLWKTSLAHGAAGTLFVLTLSGFTRDHAIAGYQRLLTAIWLYLAVLLLLKAAVLMRCRERVCP